MNSTYMLYTAYMWCTVGGGGWGGGAEMPNKALQGQQVTHSAGCTLEPYKNVMYVLTES
jgi:hypothetical protein